MRIDKSAKWSEWDGEKAIMVNNKAHIFIKRQASLEGLTMGEYVYKKLVEKVPKMSNEKLKEIMVLKEELKKEKNELNKKLDNIRLNYLNQTTKLKQDYDILKRTKEKKIEELQESKKKS